MSPKFKASAKRGKAKASAPPKSGKAKAKASAHPKGGKAKAKAAPSPKAATAKAQPAPPAGPWPAGASPWVILGIKWANSGAEIQKAFLKLSRTWHPDKGGDTAVFARISAARDELMSFSGPEPASSSSSSFEPTTSWEQGPEAAQENCQMMADNGRAEKDPEACLKDIPGRAKRVWTETQRRNVKKTGKV